MACDDRFGAKDFLKIRRSSDSRTSSVKCYAAFPVLMNGQDDWSTVPYFVSTIFSTALTGRAVRRKQNEDEVNPVYVSWAWLQIAYTMT